MNAILQVFRDKQQVAKHQLARGKLIIDRSSECGLPIKEDLISREHAFIIHDKGAYWIEDLESM